MPDNVRKKTKTNWGKLIGLTLMNSAVASIGGTSVGETMGIITSDPKNAFKLAAIGAVLGAGNLIISVTQEVIREKFNFFENEIEVESQKSPE